MAELQAGQQVEGQQQEGQQDGEQRDEGEQKREAGRTYTQAELDRILGKVRKNARYLGRKEAEAEMVRHGATPRQAEQAVERQERQEPAVPKREDFENYEDFLVAKARHEGRQASREEREEAEKKARERTVAEERQKTDRQFKKHAEAVMADLPDFAEVIESADDVMISEAMGEAIKEAGAIGPRILYHLVQNPDEAARIAEIKSPAAQAREIGKLEARIEAELAKKGKKDDADEEESGEDDKGGEDDAKAEDKGPDARNADGTFKPRKKAPDPIEPSSGRSASTSSLPSDKDDSETWLRKRQAQIEREGRA